MGRAARETGLAKPRGIRESQKKEVVSEAERSHGGAKNTERVGLMGVDKHNLVGGRGVT